VIPILSTKPLLKTPKLEERSQWYLASILALLTYVVMVTITIPAVQAFANGLLVPDMMPQGYSSDYLYQFLEAIGTAGRRAYLVQLAMDVIYPFSVSLALYLGFKRSPTVARLSSKKSQVLILSPWSIMVFDYLENLAVLIQILAFPTPLEVIGVIAPLFSITKSLVSTLVFTTALILYLYRIRQHLALLTLPLSGTLGLAALLIRGLLPVPGTEGWSEVVVSDVYLLSGLMLAVAYVLPFFGFFEIYRRRQTTFTYWAFMLSVLGTALALPTMGVVIFAAPEFAALSTPTSYIAAITQGMVVGIPAAICYTLGPMFFLPTLLEGEDSKVAKTGYILFGTHGILLSFGFGFFPLLLVGWIFLLIGSLALVGLK
jgi:hypothetical protein